MLWLSGICVILLIVVVFLWGRIILLHRAADEISREFAYRLENDTNTLIMLSTRDPHMRTLAAEINEELRLLRRERRRLQQGNRELKEAVMGISHDLRTPLTAIRGYTGLLAESVYEQSQVKRYLSLIEDRILAMEKMTEELFRYSVIEEDIILQELSLNGILEECLASYYGALKRANIAPEISMPESTVWCRLNRELLLRIIENILGNALKYSNGDLQICLCENGEISFSNKTSDMGNVKAEQLLERFYTVETGKNATGLGLSIAKALTERMGGKISAEYTEEKLFIRVWFPAVRIS